MNLSLEISLPLPLPQLISLGHRHHHLLTHTRFSPPMWFHIASSCSPMLPHQYLVCAYLNWPYADINMGLVQKPWERGVHASLVQIKAHSCLQHGQYFLCHHADCAVLGFVLFIANYLFEGRRAYFTLQNHDHNTNWCHHAVNELVWLLRCYTTQCLGLLWLTNIVYCIKPMK